MIGKLNEHYSFTNPATVHDEEALTTLELVGRTTAKLNEVIGDQNTLREETTSQLDKQENVVIPENVKSEVQKQIDNGTFDDAIDEYAGLLNSRVDNLVSNTVTGGTTMDAEVIDARVGYNGTTFNNLGIAIREQFNIFARRYRNYVRGMFSYKNLKLNNNTTDKVLEMNSNKNIIIFGENSFTSIPSGSYTIDYGTILNGGSDTLMLMYSTTNGFYFKKYIATEKTEGDFILALMYFNTTGAYFKVICCEELTTMLYQDNVFYGATEVSDAHISYDGTIYDTLGYAIREQFKKVARRYRNYVSAVTDTVNINIDTTNHVLELDTTNKNLILFGNNSYCVVTPNTYSIEYMSKVETGTWTLSLVYSPNTQTFRFEYYQANIITEGDFVVAVIYFNGNTGGVIKIVCCDEIKDMFYINGNKYSSASVVPLNRKTCNIFRKVVCCGDSFTAGFITDANGTRHDLNENYAYPHYMSLLTGGNYINCGQSGATVNSWQVVSRGLPKAQSVGKAQAYIIGLMINDTGAVELGTIDDIGTDNTTYYGSMSKIVRELNAISPKAKIFICTCPNSTGNYPQFNQAVYDIVESYKDTYPIHCLDLLAHHDLYGVASVKGDIRDGHYTAIGYEQFAEILCHIMSEYINANIKDFQDVAFIEYDE